MNLADPTAPAYLSDPAFSATAPSDPVGAANASAIHNLQVMAQQNQITNDQVGQATLKILQGDAAVRDAALAKQAAALNAPVGVPPPSSGTVNHVSPPTPAAPPPPAAPSAPSGYNNQVPLVSSDDQITHPIVGNYPMYFISNGQGGNSGIISVSDGGGSLYQVNVDKSGNATVAQHEVNIPDPSLGRFELQGNQAQNQEGFYITASSIASALGTVAGFTASLMVPPPYQKGAAPLFGVIGALAGGTFGNGVNFFVPYKDVVGTDPLTTIKGLQ